MKKRLGVAFLLVMTLALSGCCLSHNWQAATCEQPQTCSKCGEKQGEALGHTWVDANCTAPKTCATCKATMGEALGHVWIAANCDTPKTCAVCRETEGEALGHVWMDADCTTPKTCSICRATDGEALGHTWVDADCLNPKTCSACGETEGEPKAHRFVRVESCDEPTVCSVCGAKGQVPGHEWLDATCTEPKTCKYCDKKEGFPVHMWEEATCTKPKTCTLCGKQEGIAAPHVRRIDRKADVFRCAVCGKEEKIEFVRQTKNGSAELLQSEIHKYEQILDEVRETVTSWISNEPSTVKEVHDYEARWQKIEKEVLAIAESLTLNRPPEKGDELWLEFRDCFIKIADYCAQGTNLDANQDGRYNGEEMLELLRQANDGIVEENKKLHELVDRYNAFLES